MSNEPDDPQAVFLEPPTALEGAMQPPLRPDLDRAEVAELRQRLVDAEAAGHERLAAAQQPTHVRVGGNAGVRVTPGGTVQRKRVTGVDPASADHTLVPKEVLAELKHMLTLGWDEPDALRQAVSELLEPWL